MSCKNRDLLALLNAAWQDYRLGKLAMLQLPQEIEAVRFAVERLKEGDREMAEAESVYYMASAVFAFHVHCSFMR